MKSTRILMALAAAAAFAGGAAALASLLPASADAATPQASPIAIGATDQRAPTPGALAVQRGDVRNVKDFGAACTGQTDDEPAVLAAVRSFAYTNGLSAPTGGTVAIPDGCTVLFGETLHLAGYNGVRIVGNGRQGEYAAVVKVRGNFPAIDVIGAYAANTVRVGISGLTFVGPGGMDAETPTNTAADAIVEAYTNTAEISHNLFLGWFHGVDLTGVWQLRLDENRWDGAGRDQSWDCIYMRVPSDPSDTVQNNSVISHHNICQNPHHEGLRAENAAGSMFDHDQFMGGVTGVHFCDPPTATTANKNPAVNKVLCQFAFFDHVQVDSTSGAGWIVKRGLAAGLGNGVVIDQPWAGNTVGAAMDIEGAGPNASLPDMGGVQVLDAELVSTDVGMKLVDDADSVFGGHIANYDRNNNGAGSVVLSGATSGNVVRVSAQAHSGTTPPGYNGIVEAGAFSSNQLWGGPAPCSVGLAFGGSAAGVGYEIGPGSANECLYEVQGLTVRIQALVALSGTGAAVGPATLTGLPIRVGPAVPWGYGGVSLVNAQRGFVLPSGVYSVMLEAVPASDTAVFLGQTGSGAASLTAAGFGSDARFSFSLSYAKQ
jgi:hypothetical protein